MYIGFAAHSEEPGELLVAKTRSLLEAMKSECPSGVKVVVGGY
jgi:hypothetical protein